MSVTVRMSMRQWLANMQALGATRFKQALERGALSAAMRSIPEMQSRALKANPASPRGSEGAFDTGRYNAAWRAGPLPGIGARLYNLQPYSAVVEHGRRVGKRVGRAGLRNLELWAQRKLGVSQQDAKSAAFAIARSITKRGLQGRKIMTGEGVLEKLQQFLTEEVNREIAREVARKV